MQSGFMSDNYDLFASEIIFKFDSVRSRSDSPGMNAGIITNPFFSPDIYKFRRLVNVRENGIFFCINLFNQIMLPNQ